MTAWEGITTGGTPSRQTTLGLDSKSLSGTIPVQIGLLSDLTHLHRSNSSLTGRHATRIGPLYKLESLKVSKNSLTGCIPLRWKDIAVSDLSCRNGVIG